MTRKDYVLIAAALKAAKLGPYGACSDWPAGADDAAAEQHTADVTAIADALADDNPRFDRARFLTACGVDSNAR